MALRDSPAPGFSTQLSNNNSTYTGDNDTEKNKRWDKSDQVKRGGSMLAIREHCHQNTKIFDLSGRFDANSKLGLEVAILGAKEMGCHHIVLNFSNITWIDSKGLGQLFLWYHNMRLNHVHLSIVSPQSTVKHLLESAHLSDIVPIYQSEQEAIEAHKASLPTVH